MRAMWKIMTAVALTLAAGVAGAAEKKETITLAEAKKICGDRDGCGYCSDQKCDHGWEVLCKGDKCTKTTFFIKTPKPSRPEQKKGAAERKMLGGGILDTRAGFSSNSPAATGVVAPTAAPGPSLR